MSVVAARKCVIHPAREAVARCPSCGQNFCGECVLEHEGRLLCTTCLGRETATAVSKAPRTSWRRLGRVAVTVACVGLLWLGFYCAGSLLRAIPSKVHDGTIWQELPR